MALPAQYGRDLYAVFAFNRFYPGPGWADFYDAFPTLAEARASARQSTAVYDYWQIVNLTTLSKIEEGSKNEAN